MQVFASTGGRSNSENELIGRMGMNPLAASNHAISSAFHSLARFEMCSATTRQLRSTIIVQKRAYIAVATRNTHHTKSGYLLARRFSYRAESLHPDTQGWTDGSQETHKHRHFGQLRPVCWAPAVSTQPSICCHEQASKLTGH
jgi:hypothetical protein